MLPTTKTLCVLTAALLLTRVARAASDSTCVGDCNENSVVTVEEILTMANIALGAAPIAACQAGDADHNDQITVDEILTAVHNALTSCPAPVATETPTPVATELPTASPTATPTLGTSIAAAVAGHAAIIVDTMNFMSSVVAGVITGIESSGGSALVYDAAATPGDGPCPAGGMATRTGTFPLSASITLDNCAVHTFDGTATFNGGIQESLNIFGGNLSFSLSIPMAFADQMGMSTATANATLTGTISPALSNTCYVSSATFTLTQGNLNVTRADGTSMSLTFSNTTMVIDNINFNNTIDCVPVAYRLTFNGTVGLFDTENTLTTVDLSQFVIAVDNSGNPALFTLSGGINTSCFGGMVTLSTDPALNVPSHQNCPTAGTITVMLPTQGQAHIVFQSNQSVDIDDDGNGTTDRSAPNCLDPRLLMCVA
jgi:hypothetical protein